MQHVFISSFDALRLTGWGTPSRPSKAGDSADGASQIRLGLIKLGLPVTAAIEVHLGRTMTGG